MTLSELITHSGDVEEGGSAAGRGAVAVMLNKLMDCLVMKLMSDVDGFHELQLSGGKLSDCGDRE